MLSLRGQKLWNFLATESLGEERAKETHWISELENRKNGIDFRSHAFLPEKLFKLQQNRARLSNSLGRSLEAVNQWNKGQELLNLWVSEDRQLTLSDIQILNELLCRSESQPSTKAPHLHWRTTDIFTTQVKHLPPEDLDKMMEAFWVHLEEALKTKHAVIVAFICRYWILSIHPFQNGNGRTSQFLADYYLLKEGFPPQSFASKLEINLIGDPEKKSFMTPHLAFSRFCQTVLNSFYILDTRELSSASK